MTKAGVILIVSTALLISFGMIMVFNTTAAEVLDKSLSKSTHEALFKQSLYAALGIVLGSIAGRFGYQNIVRVSFLLLFIVTVCLVLVFIPKIGQEINGAKRWISLLGLSFQPSEVAKYVIPIYFVGEVLRRDRPLSFFEFVKVMAVISVPSLLIFLEPDNGTAFIIAVSLTMLFILCRVKLSFWALPLAIVVVAGSIVAYRMPHVPDRIRIYLHPELDIRGKGHQPYQAKIAAGSGGLFGKGLGESLQKLNYLPEARSDYIAAIYAEEFGFLGMASLIFLYMLIAFGGFCIAISSHNQTGFYLAAIMTFLISFQVFLNLGVVSGLLPSKGTPLPFFSQGGTALVMNIVALFLLLNVNKDSRKKAFIG